MNPAREARRGEFASLFIQKHYRNTNKSGARRAPGEFSELFIQNTEEIQINPGREARRGNFWLSFENNKEIQINPAREARRGESVSLFIQKY